MPTIDFRNIGEVLNYEFLRGTITEIDTIFDTCTVTIDGFPVELVPLFFHISGNGNATQQRRDCRRCVRVFRRRRGYRYARNH